MKSKIKNISKQFSIVKAKQRKADITMCKEMIQRNFPENVRKNIEELENSIKDYQSNGNRIRCNTPYTEKITKKEERLQERRR